MKSVKYLNQPFIYETDIPKQDNDPWDALVMRGLSAGKKIDLFYRLQINHEVTSGKKEDTDTVERRLIAKCFSRKAQGIWMNSMLRLRDARIWNQKEPEIDIRILDDLFKNHGAMISVGEI